MIKYSCTSPVLVMTSGRAGGLKNREPLKVDYRWQNLKVVTPLLPGPGARTLIGLTFLTVNAKDQINSNRVGKKQMRGEP
jgi:hypothetical protein